MKNSGAFCNRVTYGRKRSKVSIPSDMVTEPTEAMILLARMKNEGHSWRSLAEELGGKQRGISHALVRRVTLGYCNSRRIMKALGLVKTSPRNRVWMRTDNLDKAIETLLKHYPVIVALQYCEENE